MEPTLDLSAITLSEGSHKGPAQGHCAMELASQLAGEEWSAGPKCVSFLLARFMRRLNDDCGDTLRPMLLPIVPLCLGTSDDGHDDHRSNMVAAWLTDEWAPTWLSLALMSLPPLDGPLMPLSCIQPREYDAWQNIQASGGDAAWRCVRYTDRVRPLTWHSWTMSRHAVVALHGRSVDLSAEVNRLGLSAINLARRLAMVGK